MLDDFCNAAMDFAEFISPGSRARTAKVLSGTASFLDVINWLTLGYPDTVERAIYPEKKLSLQHWIDSAVTVTIPLGLFKTFLPKPTLAVIWPTEVANPLANTQYTTKVITQMGTDKLHGFPTLVDTLATYADAYSFIGGDKMVYTKVQIPGSMIINNILVEGFYEYIIDSSGMVNHRFFNFK